MKARAETFSTEEFAMWCSDQGGLPGRRGLRVRDIYIYIEGREKIPAGPHSQVKVWLSATQVCKCSKGRDSTEDVITEVL